MQILLGFLIMAASIALIKYRETAGDMVGDADWMRYFGGVYNMMILLGVFGFIYGVASMTGTTHVLLSPLRFLLPISAPPASPADPSLF